MRSTLLCPVVTFAAVSMGIEIAHAPPDLTLAGPHQVADAAAVIGAPGDHRTPRLGTPRLPLIPSRAETSARRHDPAPAAGIDADWNNFGGNARRNGRAGVAGPDAARLLWENDDDDSIIAWHPVTRGHRAFAIRESGFPGAEANDALVAYDLDTGEELWRTTVPYAGDPDEEWIAYVAGANEGRVYAARGGSGRTTPIYAYDVTNGDLLWDSDYETVAGPQDGVVFHFDGDLLVGDFDNIVRIDSEDGSTVWGKPRSCPVSGNCGCVLKQDAVFIDEPAVGGNVIAKYDIETGDYLYETPLMPGFTAQNAPFVSADGGTVYFARSQNNATVDFLYAFRDTGTALEELWHRPVRWTTSHEHGLAADGSIYTFLPGNEFVRLDPATGDVLNTAGTLEPIGAGNLSPRTAVGADGTVYVSNGWGSNPASNGRIWAFTGDLDTNLFTLALDRQNSGGPSLGAGGTLVVADRTSVRAYRMSPPCPGDLDGNGDVGFNDIVAILSLWGPCSGCPEDLDGDGIVGFSDLVFVLSTWGPCP